LPPQQQGLAHRGQGPDPTIWDVVKRGADARPDLRAPPTLSDLDATPAGPAPVTNPFLEFRAKYEFNAALFVEEVLGMDGRDEDHTIDAEQRLVLDVVSREVDPERRVAIRSGHGVGKTCLLAWIIVWALCCRFPLKIVCTAPTGGQLFDALAAEAKTWIHKLPQVLQELFDLKSEEIVHRLAPEECFVSFRTSRAETPEALAGIHAEAGWVFLILDEGSGVAEQVVEAASGSMSGRNAVTIVAGNPVRVTGFFYNIFHKLREQWFRVHISCIGHRRISPDFIEQMRRTYGEDSNAYRVRVLGEFPKAENDSVIARDLIEAAIERQVAPKEVDIVWGVDVSDGGRDRASLSRRQGNVTLGPPEWKLGLETMQVVGWVKQRWDETPADRRPSQILVDAIGIGAGVAQRLAELGLPARGINVSETPPMQERFSNLKSELWFKAKEWFEARDCRIEDDAENYFSEELAAVRFLPPQSNGKLRLEPKKDTKKRLQRSPDLADSFILTFAGDATGALLGTNEQRDWKTPLKRVIRGLM
jgi:phage terminase large subunit